MQLEKVINIFYKNKDSLLEDATPSLYPTAVLLGGQGGCGKSNLNLRVKEDYPSMSFIEINGDNYRIYHPDYDVLCKDDLNFSRESQIFSNVFTEGLISDASHRKISVIIEGTMRNPATVFRTANYLRGRGYEIKAYIIAAPQEFSSVNVICRYCNELKLQGYGRLVDFQSHDAAVRGLPVTADAIYKERLADEIHIYDMFANNLRSRYYLSAGLWNSIVPPSEVIESLQSEQLQDASIIEKILKSGTDMLDDVPASVKPLLYDSLDRLMKFRECQCDTQTDRHFHR